MKKKIRTAKAFRLPPETVETLDWLKEHYHIATRTSALIIALGNEAFRLRALDSPSASKSPADPAVSFISPSAKVGPDAKFHSPKEKP